MTPYLNIAALRRLRHLLSVCCLGICAVSAQAQTTLFQQSFSSGLGSFSSAGSVSASSAGATMTAALLSADGSITSSPISTVGHNAITLSFDRVTTALDIGEGGIAEVSVNGGAFTQLESTRTTTNGRITVSLPTRSSGL